MEREEAFIDLGAVVDETRGGPELPAVDGIGDFGGSGLADD